MGYLTQKQVAERLAGKALSVSVARHVSDSSSSLWILYLDAARAAENCLQVREQDAMTVFTVAVVSKEQGFCRLTITYDQSFS